MRFLFAVAAILVLSLIFGFFASNYPTSCIVFGNDHCHFMEAEKLFSGRGYVDQETRFALMMEHCSKMGPEPKRNKCYYFTATVSHAENTIKACNEVIDAWGKSKKECIENKGFMRR